MDEEFKHKTTYQIGILDNMIKHLEKEMNDSKISQKSYNTILFSKIEDLRNEMHQISLSIKDVVINQQKESIKNNIWMKGLLLGFIGQIIIGVLLFNIKGDFQ